MYPNRAGTSQEIEVGDATKGVVLRVLAVGCGVVDLDVHAVGVQEEDAMSAQVATVVEVDRVLS